MERRWLRVKDIHEVALSVEQYDFCLAHPLPVLLAAEVRNGHLIRPISADKKRPNPTMVYRTSGGQTLDEEQAEPPIRFMLIRGRNPTAEGDPVNHWMSVGRTSRSDLMINDYTISEEPRPNPHQCRRASRAGGHRVDQRNVAQRAPPDQERCATAWGQGHHPVRAAGLHLLLPEQLSCFPRGPLLGGALTAARIEMSVDAWRRRCKSVRMKSVRRLRWSHG